MTNLARFTLASYEQCKTLINGKMTRKLKGNTYLQLSSEPDGTPYYYVLFYDTRIVSYYKDGRIILDTGGNNTSTTKARIKQYSPKSIYSKNYVLYVGEMPFFNGINVGTPQNEHEALYLAAINGDKVAKLALKDMKEERD